MSGAGFGLLAWLGISLLLLHARADLMPALYPLQAWALAAGGALAAMGAWARPLRPDDGTGSARRMLSRWRTCWLAREGLASVATLLVAAATLAALLWAPAGADRAVALGALGLLLALLALAAVACTAMVPASLPAVAVAAWRHPLVLPVRLLCALALGLGLLFWLMALLLPFGGVDAGMLATLAALGLVLALSKALYWREVGRLPPAGAAGPAPGAPERPAARLRRTALALLVGGPLLCWALAPLSGLPAAPLLAVSTLSLLAGAFVERWLFFAQAPYAAAPHGPIPREGPP